LDELSNDLVHAMRLFPSVSGPDGPDVETLVENGVTVVACQGELDVASARKLDAALTSATDAPLVLDLCSLNFIDSSGLFIVVKHHHVRPDSFVIACLPDGAPAQLFDMTGMSQDGTANPSALRVFSSRDAAIASFVGAPVRAA
jgi:anti-anti-sigma factor